MNRKIFRKRIFTTRGFFSELKKLYSSFGELKGAFASKRVSREFIERIMLSVTKVNGCRFCSFGHTKAALSAGISQIEIDELMRSEYGQIPRYELKAVLFAQHFAETEGNYDDMLWEDVVIFYGRETSRDIMAYIGMISFGNLSGNTFDAIIYRLKGYTVPDSFVLAEILIIVMMILFLPLVLIAGLLFK